MYVCIHSRLGMTFWKEYKSASGLTPHPSFNHMQNSLTFKVVKFPWNLWESFCFLGVFLPTQKGTFSVHIKTWPNFSFVLFASTSFLPGQNFHGEGQVTSGLSYWLSVLQTQKNSIVKYLTLRSVLSLNNPQNSEMEILWKIWSWCVENQHHNYHKLLYTLNNFITHITILYSRRWKNYIISKLENEFIFWKIITIFFSNVGNWP